MRKKFREYKPGDKRERSGFLWKKRTVVTTTCKDLTFIESRWLEWARWEEE